MYWAALAAWLPTGLIRLGRVARPAAGSGSEGEAAAGFERTLGRKLRRDGCGRTVDCLVDPLGRRVDLCAVLQPLFLVKVWCFLVSYFTLARQAKPKSHIAEGSNTRSYRLAHHLGRVLI